MGNPTTRSIEIIARGLWVEDSMALLCRNIAGGYYYFPGGHVEFGETAACALEREFAEECGERIRTGPCLLVGEATFSQNGTPRHEINLLFHVEQTCDGGDARPGIAPGVPQTVRSLEPHIAFEWVPLSAFASMPILPKWLAERVPALVQHPRPDNPSQQTDTLQHPSKHADQRGTVWVSAINFGTTP